VQQRPGDGLRRKTMGDIKGFAASRGWTDDTVITLLVEYLEDSNNTASALLYLKGVAEVEDEASEDEEEWDVSADDEDEDWIVEGKEEDNG